MTHVLPIVKEVVLATQMAKMDIQEWLEKEAQAFIKSDLFKKGITEPSLKALEELRMNQFNLSVKPSERRFDYELSWALRHFDVSAEPLRKLKSFNASFHTRFFLSEIEIIFIVHVNRKIYGLTSSLTDRELEVLKKRTEENKSLTQTASEMNISPQGVVSLMRSIKNKVKQYLIE